MGEGREWELGFVYIIIKKKVSFFPFKKNNKENKRIRINIYLLCNSVRTMCTEINLSTISYINLYPLN